MPSGLIGQPDSDVEAYDSECPECGSSRVYRDSTFTVEELGGSVSPVCDDCGHSWFESV
jgi:predicted RNA-binding Zn-ribbon protein involved in translation (DUF1610 family)